MRVHGSSWQFHTLSTSEGLRRHEGTQLGSRMTVGDGGDYTKPRDIKTRSYSAVTVVCRVTGNLDRRKCVTPRTLSVCVTVCVDIAQRKMRTHKKLTYLRGKQIGNG